MAKKKKLYVVGIDSAGLWLIKELNKESRLPGLGKMLKKGVMVEMESALPPMTGPAWPAIYTGLNPGQHGVPDFFEMKRDYTPELAFYDSEKKPPFWKTLAESGYKCLLVTPATETKLPRYKNADVITGFPLSPRTNNKYLESLIKAEKFDGEPDIEAEIKSGKMPVGEAVKHYVASIRSRTKIAERAMEREDYDFVFVCFTETDRLQHFAMIRPKMHEYLLPIYKEIDNMVNYCIDRAEKEGAEVIVLSDHGIQVIKKKILINTWLIKNEYVALKDTVLHTLAASSEKTPASYAIREKVMKTGLRKVYDKLPHSAKKAVHASVGTLFSSASTGEFTRLHLFDYDMAKTRAFAAISNINVATIFINDDRFDKPTVKKQEIPALKKELIHKIMQLRDKDGKPVIQGVYDAEPYYGKNPAFIAPDLFVDAKPGYTIDIFNFSRSGLFMEPEPPKRGDHTRMGIFGVYPKPKGRMKTDISILDVNPTIMKYFGLK